MDWIVKKERKKKKNLQVLEVSFSCFKPFGVWGVTWSMYQNDLGWIRERIDRGFATIEWLNLLPSVC